MDTETVQIEDLVPYHRNPKLHPNEQLNRIARSIDEFGFTVPIVIDKDNNIIMGHGRIEAAKQLELKEVPAVRRDDLTDEQVKALRIADNRVAESGWDDELLGQELEALDDMDFDLELTGFELDEIEDITTEEEIEPPEPENIDKNIEDIKILNLYAGIGGNRKFWGDLDITAVEYNEEIAEAYQDFFPNDKVIVEDAHAFLEEHFYEYDFIWSSPPCPTHSRIRKNTAVASGNVNPIYPDLRLYEEILFLQGYFEGKWVIENVKSWYDPLVEPKERGPHYFWSNFKISEFDLDIGENKHNNNPKKMEEYLGFDLDKYKFPSNYPKQKILNNCIHPKLGEHILKEAYNE